MILEGRNPHFMFLDPGVFYGGVQINYCSRENSYIMSGKRVLLSFNTVVTQVKI
jgi:hypothetical protein